MTGARRVSVLIPCFNAGRYLAETLGSVRQQSAPPLEVIVVDDGSTDSSREIARAAPDVTLLTNPGKGASAARTYAWQHARGEFLQFLDADDLLTPGALESRVNALETADGDVAISDWERLQQIGDEWRPVKVESGALADPDVPADVQVLRGFWAPPAAVLYRRTICARIGAWSPSLPVIQDARYLLDAARVGGRFVHAPGLGARYRQHQTGSLSTGSHARFWDDVLQNACEVERLWAQDRGIDVARRAALTTVYDDCLRLGFMRDRRLFDASRAALARSGARPSTRFVRTALFLTGVMGYRPARALLTPFCH